MKLKGIIEEDFVQYKKPSMFLISCFCDWKCCTEIGSDISVCQNAPMAQTPIHNITDSMIYEKYRSNPITSAIVIGGLEPMLQFDEIYNLIKLFRNNNCVDDFVIYTGYYPDEIQDKVKKISELKNIIIKFGRFIPNRSSIFDEDIGVNLASDNQFAIRIS